MKNHFQFFLCHDAFFAFQSDEFVEKSGRNAQQPYERIRDFGQKDHDGAEHCGISFRIAQCDGFRNKFANDE